MRTTALPGLLERQCGPLMFSSMGILKNAFEKALEKLILITFYFTNMLKYYHFTLKSKFNGGVLQSFSHTKSLKSDVNFVVRVNLNSN